MITILVQHFKEFLSKTIVTVGAPIAGSGLGLISFLEKCIPVLTVVSLITGIVLGILSYRLKVKKRKK